MVRFLIPTARRGAPHWLQPIIDFGISIYGYGYEFIVYVMNYEAASMSLDFENAWSYLTPSLRAQFVRTGLQKASTWAHLLPAEGSEGSARASFELFLPQI